MYIEFSEGVAVPGGVFPPGPGPIVASGVTCTGSEYFVSECANDTIIRSECTHDRDAGVRCTPGISKSTLVNFNLSAWVTHACVVYDTYHNYC